MHFVCFLMVINSFLEFISIGIFIPFISLMMEAQSNNIFVSKLAELLLFFGIKLNIVSICIIIVCIYIAKYLFVLFFTRKQADFIHNSYV